MFKKLLQLALLILVGMGLPSLAFAATLDWDGDIDSEWNTAANYIDELLLVNPASPPTAADRVEVDDAVGNTPDIGLGDVAVAGEVRIGRNEGAGLLTISGGSLTTSLNRFRVGAADAGGPQGTFVMTAGTLTVNNASFVTGSSSKGHVIMSGGTISIPGGGFDFNMDENTPTAASILDMSGGRIEVNDVFLVDQTATVNLSGGAIVTTSSGGALRIRRDSVVNITGGLLETKDDLELGSGATAGGTVNLDGGVLRAFRLNGAPGPTGIVNINGGKLQFLNSQETETEVAGYITSGYFATSFPSLFVNTVDVDGLLYTQVCAVPEPATMFLFLLGGVGAMLARPRI